MHILREYVTTWGGIDIVGNLGFRSRLANKLKPWHIVYIIQQ